MIRRACAPGLAAGFACLLCWTRSENVSSLFLVFLFLDYYNNCTNLSNAVCGPLGPDITIGDEDGMTQLQIRNFRNWGF